MSAEPAELVEFAIERYKNLRSVRVPCTTQMVLYGRNAVGKTNLLEAFALCFGSRATLWQLAGRYAPPTPGAISALLRSSEFELPVPPVLYQFTSMDETAVAMDQNAVFWSTLSSDTSSATSWEGAISELVGDQRLAELLVDAGRRPLVRYTLESLSGLGEAATIDRANDQVEIGEAEPEALSFTRTFARTLAIEGDPPDWLIELAPSLPVCFAPFRRWLSEPSSSRSPHADLLLLPPADWAPVRAVWLASERSAGQAWFDLWEAFENARPNAAYLVETLQRLEMRGVDDDSPVDSDSDFWLVCKTVDAINSALTVASLGIETENNGEHPSWIGFFRSAPWESVGTLSDPTLFAQMSSGERVWSDIGMAQAATALELASEAAALIARAVDSFSDARKLEAAVGLADQDLPVFTEGYWNSNDVDAAVVYLQRLLGDAPDALLPENLSSSNRFFVAALLASTDRTLREALRPTLVVNLYDEPERHLHPSAQRQVHSALSAPTSSSAIVATHSHLFLGGAGWRHLFLDRTPEGTVIRPFDPSQLTLSDSITYQMGLTKGELLSTVRYVLFVEGVVDVIVLKTLYGQVLGEAGVLLLPMHGVDEVVSLAEMEIFGNVIDAGAGVLVDHARPKRIDGTKLPNDATKEERAIWELQKCLKKRGRSVAAFGLTREDIIEYLADDAVRMVQPAFPGWDQIRRERGRHEKIKDAAARATGGVHFGRRLVEQVTRVMRDTGIPAPGDLPSVVASVVAAASL